MTYKPIYKPKVYVDADGERFVKLSDWENVVTSSAKVTAAQQAEIAELKQRLSEQEAQPIQNRPVFRMQASPDVCSTNPSENPGNSPTTQENYKQLYWDIRTALRNAILRLPDVRVEDTSELFEKHRTSGQTLWKLTDALETLLLGIQHQTKKPLLEELLSAQRTLSHKEQEQERERWEHRQTLRKIREVVGAGGEETGTVPMNAKRVQEILRGYPTRKDDLTSVGYIRRGGV